MKFWASASVFKAVKEIICFCNRLFPFIANMSGKYAYLDSSSLLLGISIRLLGSLG